MRINIYIQDQDEDVLDYMNKQLNRSKYIVELVRRDMNNQNQIGREEIIDLIKKYAGEIKNTSSDEENEVKEVIEGMFTM